MAQGATGTGTRVGPFVEDELSVHEDIFDALTVAERVLIRGTIQNALRVKDCDIGMLAGLQ